LLCVSFFFPPPSVLVSLFSSLFCLQSLGIAISWFPATHSRKAQLLDLTIGKEEEEEEEPAARTHSGRTTPAPCLDPSGKQEHRQSRGDAAITHLSSTASRGGKKQTNEQANHKRRKASKKDGKKQEFDEGPSVESGDESVRMYPEVLNPASARAPHPQVPAQKMQCLV
jgi:hypothetical protein